MDTAPSHQATKIAHTIPEAVQASGLSRSALYLALKSGTLRARKLGSRTLIEDGELRRFINSLPSLASHLDSGTATANPAT